MATVPKQQLPYNPATMTVVVIDDQDTMRKGIRRVLSTMGFTTILEYFDGHDALKAMSKQTFPVDLIVTDLYMRRTGGLEVLQRVRTKDFGSDIPVLVVTGEGAKEDIIQAIDAGADEYVLKPFQVSEIEKKVSAVLLKYHSPPPLLKLIRQGERLLHMGEFSDAIKIFEAAQRLDPTSTRAQYLKALTLDAMGHPGEALHLLKESAANNSTFYKNYTAMANIYLKLDQKIHAVDAIKSELELNPKQAHRQVMLAKMLIEQGDGLGAIEHFRASLKENGKLKEALIGMGQAYETIDNQEKAIYYFKRARRNHPNNTLALELIVKCFESKGEFRKAIPLIMEEISTAPNKSDARIIAARLYSRADEVTKALKVLDDGLIRDPQNVGLLKAKAKALMVSQDAATACTIYQKVVSLEPTSQHYALLGFSFLQDRQHKKALEAVQTALLDTTDHPKIFTMLSEIYRQLNCPQQAATMIAFAIKSPGTASVDELKAEYTALMASVKLRRGPQKMRPETTKKVS